MYICVIWFLLQIKQRAPEYLSLHNHSSWKVDLESVLFLLTIYKLNEKQKFMHKAHKVNPVDTGRKFNLRRSEDVLNVFWTSYVRSIYVLCLRGKN